MTLIFGDFELRACMVIETELFTNYGIISLQIIHFTYMEIWAYDVFLHSSQLKLLLVLNMTDLKTNTLFNTS